MILRKSLRKISTWGLWTTSFLCATLWGFDGLLACSEVFSPQSVSDLKEVAFATEYGSGNQLRKWVVPIRIAVRGTLPEYLSRELDRVIAELRELTDRSIERSEQDANVTIFFIPHAQFSAQEIEIPPRNDGYFHLWWNREFEIERALVYIAIDRNSKKAHRHLLREELTQALGLMADTNERGSIFEQRWTETVEYSDRDRALIRLHSSPLLPPGINVEGFRAIASRVANGCEPW